jgi:hypothetical protein
VTADVKGEHTKADITSCWPTTRKIEPAITASSRSAPYYAPISKLCVFSKIEGRKQSQSNLNPGAGDCIWREPCFHQRGFCKPKDMLLIKPDAAQQVLKPRVAAHGIEVGVYFEPLQDSRLLFVGLVAPEECVIVIVERQVRSNKGT